jgi:hypothetical protein
MPYTQNMYLVGTLVAPVIDHVRSVCQGANLRMNVRSWTSQTRESRQMGAMFTNAFNKASCRTRIVCCDAQ